MKKIYLILSMIVLTISVSLLIVNNEKKTYFIEYNGIKLALSVDGEKVKQMPTGKYFLVNYECNQGTELTWDYETSKLTSSNYNINDSCTLEFSSSPKLYDLVNIGDYISYTGDYTNGCVEPQCSGFNANQGTSETGEFDTYGYCFSDENKFYTYGWRILHKDSSDNTVYIVSAGAPECVAVTSSDSTATIASLKTASLKYCNNKYLSGGVCNETTVHPFNGDDFYKFTSQYYGSSNARYLYSYNDGGTYGNPQCWAVYSSKYCGYNNDLVDNGGCYWFGSAYDSSYTLLWTPGNRIVTYSISSTIAYGLRPVLKLDSSIQATGGAGTMTNPYTISERVTTQ